jgi:hypothetical protein
VKLYERVRTNFETLMQGQIADLNTSAPLEQTGELVDLGALPEAVVGERYALQCLGIIEITNEINTVYFTTFRVRLQLSFFAADRFGYDDAIENFAAVARARADVASWNGVFDRLELITSQFAETKGVVFGNLDFAVKVRG